MSALILIVEDDASTGELVKEVLEAERHEVAWAKTVAQGRTYLRKGKPDLLILDRALPDQDGLDFCKELREAPETKSLPVLFLTGKKTVTDKVMGLKFGGDDYLTKPFNAEELVARVDALLRRSRRGEEQGGTLAAGPISMDVEGRRARVDGKAVDLTPKEFDLLRAFIERKGRVLTRMFLLSNVWGYGMDVELNTKAVDMVLVGLRRKLGKHGEWIESVKGYGFRFSLPD